MVNGVASMQLFVKVAHKGYYLGSDGTPLKSGQKYVPCNGLETVGWDEGCTRRIPRQNGEAGIFARFYQNETGQWHMSLLQRIDLPDTVVIEGRPVPIRDLVPEQVIPLFPGDRGCFPLGAELSVDFTAFTTW